MDAPDRSKIVELEYFVLQFMCSGQLDDASMADARRKLAAYDWQDEENRVVFDALARIRNAEVVPIRAQLAEHVTRMGFPEVDWGNYLPPIVSDPIDGHRIDPQKVKQAIEALLADHTDHK